LQLEGYKGEDGLDDRGPEHRGYDHIIIKRTEETVLVQAMDGEEKQGLRALPFPDNQAQ
jgi:hypothetical protein